MAITWHTEVEQALSQADQISKEQFLQSIQKIEAKYPKHAEEIGLLVDCYQAGYGEAVCLDDIVTGRQAPTKPEVPANALKARDELFTEMLTYGDSTTDVDGRYQELLKAYPDFAEVRADLGLYYQIIEEDKTLATQYIEGAYSQSPDSIEVNKVLGLYYLYEGDLAKAMFHSHKALHLGQGKLKADYVSSLVLAFSYSSL